MRCCWGDATAAHALGQLELMSRATSSRSAQPSVLVRTNLTGRSTDWCCCAWHKLNTASLFLLLLVACVALPDIQSMPTSHAGTGGLAAGCLCTTLVLYHMRTHTL